MPGAKTRTILWAFALTEALVGQVPAKVDFAKDVQPLLKEHCIECHGPSQQMRGLRLDRRRDALPNRVGANGARIVPGNSSASLLFRRLSGTQSGAQMPPDGPLAPDKINLLKGWIDQGADWPDELSGTGDTSASDPRVVKIMNALRNGEAQEFQRTVLASPDAVNAKGSGGWTPIMFAALYGDAASVRLLLQKGANVNAQNDHGGTALMYAIDNEEKTKLLLDSGANPNLRSGQGRTALLIAVGRVGSYSISKMLLDKGADAALRLPDGRTALNMAVGSRDPKLLQLLLDHGVDKKTIPLAPLLAAGCTACFDVLLPLAELRDLNLGLQAAVRAGDQVRIRALLERGAQSSPNLLHFVAIAPEPIPQETIKVLINRGADVLAKTTGGVTTLDLARRNGNDALVSALKEAGARDEHNGIRPQLRLKPAPSARAAVERVLPALQRTGVAFLERAGCVSCHNNSLTEMTIASARTKGLKVDDKLAQDQSSRITSFLEENHEGALENDGLPGGTDTVSYILLGLAAEGYPSDRITDAWARYLKNNQAADGRFRCFSNRPPLESSDFEVTAAAIKSLKTYGPRSQRADYEKSVQQAVRWLETAQPVSTEDHVFQILGLVWGAGNQAAVRKAGQALLASQRADGGWSQTKALPSDAYATGQALVALHQAGITTAASPAYGKGVQHLLNSQLEDGSWCVVSRAVSLQPYFDSGFPHGPDQFISAAASNWASMALLNAVLR